jgi:acyl-CoA reductase-like NAD-dependent aldehyde dehydrogenase
MGIDPETPEHVVDAVDQQLEEAVERIAGLIHQAQSAGRATDSEERSGILAALQGALQRLESAVARIDAVAGTTGEVEGEALPVDEVTRAATQAEKAVAGAEDAVGPIADAPPPTTVRRLDRG